MLFHLILYYFLLCINAETTHIHYDRQMSNINTTFTLVTNISSAQLMSYEVDIIIHIIPVVNCSYIIYSDGDKVGTIGENNSLEYNLISANVTVLYIGISPIGCGPGEVNVIVDVYYRFIYTNIVIICSLLVIIIFFMIVVYYNYRWKMFLVYEPIPEYSSL